LVDDRVVAIIPIVYDALHLIPSLHHMWRAYGGWTFAFSDYWELNMTKYLDTPEFEWLCQIQDPYYYLADPTRLRMPKLIINAAGDEFFQGDNDQYWWDYMPEPKFRQMCEDAEHSEVTGIPGIMGNIAAWGNTFFQGGKWPQFNWTIDETDGHITLYNDPSIARPINVSMWSAASYERTKLRDWRLLGGNDPTLPQPVIWRHDSLTETAPNSNMWVAKQNMPEQGWMGFFIEGFYPGPHPYWNASKETHYRLTTQISIIPRNLWYTTDCYGVDCYGTLV